MKAPGAAFLLLLAAGATPAWADDVSADLACKFRHGVSEVDSFRALPPAIVSLARERMRAGNLPDGEIIAPRGGAFNATDVILKPAPGRRFIRAGRSGNRWFFWYEQGGIAYSKYVAVFELPPGGGAARLLAHAAYFTENPCALTDLVLDGRTPPRSDQSDWW